MMHSNWSFHDPPNLAVITLSQIIELGHPILYVSHDSDDGGWQFLHGGDVQMQDARVVALREIVERDPTLLELADLPLGWYAWRSSVSEPWIRVPHERGA
jgi:hypothetical protein